MKKYFAEYEHWMLNRPASVGASIPRPSFRDLLKTEVESLVKALRDGNPFQPYRFEHAMEAQACNTSSVTI
jgi:hypothetical protein